MNETSDIEYIEIPIDEFAKTPLGWKYVKSEGTIQIPEHLIQISEHLELTARGEIHFLFVCAPPGHGKSELCSRDFPCWYFDQDEFVDNRVGLVSYGADFAVEWGRKVRNQLDEYGKHKLAPDSQAASRWNLRDSDGGMYATGIGGPITGRRLMLLLIDDPIKNNIDALSKTKMMAQGDWMIGTALDRLEPNAGVVITMQRWVENDLIGFMINLLEKQGIKYTILNFPAIAEENDRCGRQIGEALWRERFDEEALAIKKRLLGVWYDAKYQQHPRKLSEDAPDPAWFVRKHFVDIAPYKGSPRITKLVRYVDMAAKTEANVESGDYLAGVLTCKDLEMRFGILHSLRTRKIVSDVEDLMVDLIMYDLKLAVKLGYTVKEFPRVYKFWFESDKGGTGEIAASYIARMIAHKLQSLELPVPTIEYEHPSGSKISRADPMFVQAKAGNYWILDDDWAMQGKKYETTLQDDFLERVCTGGDTEIDDEMDGASGSFGKLFSAAEKLAYEDKKDPTVPRNPSRLYPATGGAVVVPAVIRRANLFKRNK